MAEETDKGLSETIGDDISDMAISLAQFRCAARYKWITVKKQNRSRYITRKADTNLPSALNGPTMARLSQSLRNRSRATR